LFHLIFIALQNVGVISAVPCILIPVYSSFVYVCIVVDESWTHSEQCCFR